MAKARGLVQRINPERPIVLGHYTLTETGVDIKGKPSFEEHEDVGRFIKRAHRASGWWMADWLRYGDSRTDWAERLSQAVDVTGLTEKTLKNVRAIGRIERAIRRPGNEVEFSHHGEVAGLEPVDQAHWLSRAAVEGWTKVELRQEIRASKRRKVIQGQAVLEGMYRVLYADPPWLYRDMPPTKTGTGAQRNAYLGMTIEQLCDLPVKAHALENSILFLWVTVPLLLEYPGPREVLTAWGFTYKSARVWDKVLGMPSHYGQQLVHEELIIATRGSCQPDQPLPHDRSIFTERRGEHSQKPAEARAWIMKHWTTGPYLELFASERTEGWDAFGNDARLWAKEATA